MVGLSHNTQAPVEVRERIAFTMPGALDRALGFLRQSLSPGEECLLLSTCNRTELYLSTPGDRSSNDLVDLLTTARRRAEPEETGAVLPADLTRYIEEQRGHHATEHLFRVAAGLDSMVLGESDIVRQLKDAYARANDNDLCGPALHAAVHEALRVGKRARTETDLARGAFSIGHAAAQLAENIFGGLQGRTVLLLGAGKMSETTARHLAASGASTVLVANRTFDRAARLAELLNGRAIRYEEFATHLARTDIVIASTAAPHYVVDRAMVEPALKARRRRQPLFLIDIAVPRDIDPAVGELDDVFLYDIDDLQAVVDADRAERRQRGARAEALVHEEALAFAARLRTQQTATPIVSDLRAKHRAIRAEEMERLRTRLTWTPEQWQAIELTLQAIENKTLHDPTRKIREYAAVGDSAADAKIETARELFGLTTDRDTPNVARDEAADTPVKAVATP
jgi:glutamyl-tRNA reductase